MRLVRNIGLAFVHFVNVTVSGTILFGVVGLTGSGSTVLVQFIGLVMAIIVFVLLSREPTSKQERKQDSQTT